MTDYNGVTLPDLPTEVDRSVYPYAHLENLVSYYDLQFSTQPLYYRIDDAENGYDSVYYPVGTEYLSYGAISESTEWMEFGAETVTEDTPAFNPDVIIWSDHDIVNDETGEIFFPSSVEDPGTTEEEDKDYRIKGSTLKAFGDHARRFNNTTDKLTTNEMIEIFSNLLLVEGVKF